jgi:hypothetical protein
MSEKEKDGQHPESPAPMSRRNFALGSMAVVGAYSAFAQDTLPPLSEEARALKLEISDDVRKLLDERHVLDDDIRRVIDHAESTGLKLFQPDTPYFLSKMRIHEAMFYVEYSKDKGAYKIHTAYTHRFKLGEE